MELLNSVFTTSRDIAKICTKIGTMSSLKQFFEYEFEGEGCKSNNNKR